MPETPPRIELPDHDPVLNEETARLLLRMLLALDAQASTHPGDAVERAVEGDVHLRGTARYDDFR